MTKKIVKLNGGLGNQMFQYAFAVALAKKFGNNIIFDFSFFDEIIDPKIATKREFELNNFNFDCPAASEEELQKVVAQSFKSKFHKEMWKIFKLDAFRPIGNQYLQKNANEFDAQLFKDAYYHYNGYFQNEKYFEAVKDDLREKFSLRDELDEKNKNVLKQINSCEAVSIHVRRGDYVTLESASKFHGVCSIDYYNKAIRYITKRVKTPHFFIFSDDIKWVEENLKLDYPTTIVDFNNGKGWLDLNLMKSCKHNIVANSSFSWWGAWLNSNPKKIVIAPKIWFAQKPKCDIAPKSWVRF